MPSLGEESAARRRCHLRNFVVVIRQLLSYYTVEMNTQLLSIGELADAAGITARAVRFYVQQQILPKPIGRGRGSHYGEAHLDRLRRIVELQARDTR